MEIVFLLCWVWQHLLIVLVEGSSASTSWCCCFVKSACLPLLFWPINCSLVNGYRRLWKICWILGFNISSFDALASGTGLTHQLVPSAWAGGPSASQLNARHEESGNNGDGFVPAGQLFRPSPPLCPHPCRSFNLDARIIRRLRIIKHPSISHPPWPKARKKTGEVLRTGRLP